MGSGPDAGLGFAFPFAGMIQIRFNGYHLRLLATPCKNWFLARRSEGWCQGGRGWRFILGCSSAAALGWAFFVAMKTFFLVIVLF